MLKNERDKEGIKKKAFLIVVVLFIHLIPPSFVVNTNLLLTHICAREIYLKKKMINMLSPI